MNFKRLRTAVTLSVAIGVHAQSHRVSGDMAPPMFLAQTKDLLRKHPGTTIVSAHTGVGRVIHPVHSHAAMMEAILKDPAFRHVYPDISWDLVARYIVDSDQSLRTTSGLINRFPDRFLFGSDEVGPRTPEKYFKVFETYEPLWELLSPEASELVRKGNYERIFDAARTRVRAWEHAHVPSAAHGEGEL